MSETSKLQIFRTKCTNAFALFIIVASALVAFKCDICAAYDDDLTIAKVNCIAHDSKFTCNCGNRDEPMVLPRLMGYVYQVEISNCTSLLIQPNTFDETQGLRFITIQSVQALELQSYALAFPLHVSNTALIIEFHEVNFKLIDSHAINGNIEEISFFGGRIENIKPFGFTTLKERALLLNMNGVVVHQIEAQAFKKFFVENLKITNCHFETTVPSKAFYELEVLTMLLQNNRFKTVHTKAFSFQLASKLSILHNRFETLDAEWIDAYVAETVSIRDNEFGTVSEISFKGIGVQRDYRSSEPLHLQFINNRVHFSLEPRPLEFNVRFVLIIQLVYYQNEFACKYVELMQQTASSTDSTANTALSTPWKFFQTYSDNIYFLHSAAVTAITITTINDQSYALLSSIIEIDCKDPIIWPYILVGVVVLLLILLIVAIGIYFYYKKKRKSRKLNVIMPDPRTYKTTEIVYKIETAGLIHTDF